jgi:hypothetical protein
VKTNSFVIIRFLIIVVAGFLISGIVVVSAQTAERGSTRNDEGKEELILSVDEYRSPWITGDTNNDGRTDYALELTERGHKRREAVDYNNDGFMDNFYFYRNGVLERQKIDTNYDGNIDLWVHMYDGVRVRGYERDTNHDGEIDLVKNFGDQ